MTDNDAREDFYEKEPPSSIPITDFTPEMIIGMQIKLYPPHLEAVKTSMEYLQGSWDKEYDNFTHEEHRYFARTITMLKDILTIGESAFSGENKNPFWGGDYPQ